MKCDICSMNAATIHMKFHVNGQQRSMKLCSECFEKLQSGALSGGHHGTFGSAGHPNGFADLTDFFGSSFSGFNAMGHDVPNTAGQVDPREQHRAAGPNRSNGSGDGLLDQLGRDLTEAARSGEIDPVIGRDPEIDRVIEILNRRTKSNPVLIGEPGVGKTAVVEGLALRIAEGTVPQKLANKHVYVLDVASLVADTGIRGQFEERMQQLLEELKQRKDVLLFIDEVHLVVGAGSAQGSMDAGNILKPALSRGEIRIIGATTFQEYRQIEKDAALERRFQPVIIEEPSVDDTVHILQGLRETYERFHGVHYSDEALRACANFSHRYIRDRQLPDKAIDLMDEAGARGNLQQEPNGATLEARLDEVLKLKEAATKEEHYELAARLRDEEVELRKAMADAKAPDDSQPSQTDTSTARHTIEAEDIAAIVERKTGIPVRRLQSAEQQKLSDLATRLNAQVIGQAEAVSQVARAVRRSRAGLHAKHRPIGSFLFVGPTGVGKTELARSLAKELFGTADAMIRLDMSEYMEGHSVAKLIGSPPGYVGHEEGGQLTEQVRRHPYRLILADEVEKAHPDVLNAFLQILEDGRLTDSQGRTVHFEDTVIIMTSNAGAGEHKTAELGFKPVAGASSGEDTAAPKAEAVRSNTAMHQPQRELLATLSRYFRPEFLNRFDAVVAFKPLATESLLQIVDLLLTDVFNNLSGRGIQLGVDTEVKEWLATIGTHPQFGARPLRRAIATYIEDLVADWLMDADRPSGSNLVVSMTEAGPILRDVSVPEHVNA